MKAARFYDARDIRIEDVALPPISDDEVEIDIEWCGICGSDKHMYLRPFEIPCPVTLGHEFSGRVTNVGKCVTNVRTGDRVTANPVLGCGLCDACRSGYPNLCGNGVIYGYYGTYGAFAEKIHVKEIMVVKIPDHMPFDLAAVVEPAAIAAHGLRVSSFKAGDTAAVFGLGPIGLLQVSLLKAAGATRIFAVGHTEARRRYAHRFGATKVIDPDREDAVGIIRKETGGGVDVSFDLAGAQETFTLGLDVLRPRGELVVVSLSEGKILFDPKDALNKEAKIVTSQCTADEFPLVVTMLADGILDAAEIITKKIYLDDIVQEGFKTILKDKSQLKILVTPKRKNL